MHLKQVVLGYFTCIFQLLSAHWHAAGVGKDMHTQQHSICRRLNSSDVYKELLNPGGKEEFRAVVVEGVERWKLTNVRAVEWWEKGEQRKLLLLGHTETRVKMYQNMSSRIDWVPADDKRSRKWKCACGTRVKAVLSFWKMRKTDALKIVRKDPFSDKRTQVLHVWKDQNTPEENHTYLFERCGSQTKKNPAISPADTLLTLSSTWKVEIHARPKI